MKSPEIRGIHHICLKVQDVAQTVKFYTSVLNYQVWLQWDRGIMLKAPDGTHLELFPEDEEKGYVHVAYVCDDVDRVYREAIDSGCESVKVPQDVVIPSDPPFPVRLAFFKDPSGDIVELFHERG